MIAAVRDYDRRGETTCLRARILDELGLKDIRDILRKVELEGMSRTEIASLARLVTESALEGDPVSGGILKQGAEELATMVATVAANIEAFQSMSRIPVVVTGGLTNAGAVFMNPLAEALRGKIPQTLLTEPLLPPVLGSALLAIELAGTPPDSNIVKRLVEEYSAKKEVCSVN